MLSYNKIVMKAKKAQKNNLKTTKKGVYKKYPFETRKKLISMVEEDNRTLASSAKELGICQTTARLIISTWREQERVFEKKTDKVRRLKRQAKKEANAQRKMKSQRQRAKIEEGGSRTEGPIIAGSQKLEEISPEIQNHTVLEVVQGVQIAENPLPLPQHLPQTLVTYQLVQIGGLYYILPVYTVPNQPGCY